MKGISVVTRAGQLVLLLCLTFTFVTTTEQDQTTLFDVTNIDKDITTVASAASDLITDEAKIEAGDLVTQGTNPVESRDSIPVVELTPVDIDARLEVSKNIIGVIFYFLNYVFKAQKDQEEQAKDICSSEFKVSAEKLARLHSRQLNDEEDDENLMVST